MIPEIRFEKDQRVIEIDYETLAKTADYEDLGSKKFPLSHSKLFETILERLDKRNVPAEVDTLYISKGGITQPKQREVDMRKDLNTRFDTHGTIVRNVVGRIQLGGDFANEYNNMSFGIGYNKQGIQLCMGTNIKICKNMSIFGGKYMYNYGAGSVPFQKMEELLTAWISQLPEITEENLRILQNMQAYELEAQKAVRLLLGDLHMKAVEAAYLDSSVEAPFNIGQLSQFSKKLIPFARQEERVSLYEVYNHGTEILTHQQTLENRWEDVSSFGDFIVDSFELIPKNEKQEMEIV